MNSRFFNSGFGILLAFTLVLSGCTPQQISATTSTAPVAVPSATANIPPTTSPTRVITPSLTPKPALTPTSALPVMSDLTLNKGEAYFTMDGRQSLVFSRNPTGLTQSDFDTVLEWAHQGGTRLIRVHLTHGWGGDPWVGEPWITKDGKVSETWAKKWDHFFDQAQADGIYVMPVFGVWADWNNGTPDLGSPFWKNNPLNQANGGPVKASGELFQTDSPTQKLWLEWVKTLVQRWQGRQNIAAWEIYSEINIASGAPAKTDAKGSVDDALAVNFTNKAVQVIRSVDQKQRPLTLSLATGVPLNDQWADYYQLNTLDFIEIHPYSEKLDRELVTDIQANLKKFNKPVMIGESGLWGPASTAKNYMVGINHAIWAGMVSGAMNARALWWNDGYAIYDPGGRAMALKSMENSATTELPAANFARDVDFAGMKPVSISYSAGTKTWGAVLGNETSAIGWFRDAKSEPPDWPLLPLISGQAITINLPGTAAHWKVDFYNMKSGTDITSTLTTTRNGKSITVKLPDFVDEIAFKMTAQ